MRLLVTNAVLMLSLATLHVISGHAPIQTIQRARCSMHVVVMKAGCLKMLPGAVFTDRHNQRLLGEVQGPGLFYITGFCNTNVTVTKEGYKSSSFILNPSIHAAVVYLEATNSKKVTVHVFSSCLESIPNVFMTSDDVTTPIRTFSPGVFCFNVCSLPVSVTLTAPGHVTRKVQIPTMELNVTLECDDTSISWVLTSSCGDSLDGATLTLFGGNITATQSRHLTTTQPLSDGRTIQLICRPAGTWTPWVNMGSCSATCDGGKVLRSRTCNVPANGLQCEGIPVEMADCNIQSCADGGAWNPWSDTSQCTATCGGGTKNRVRTCRLTPPTQLCPGQTTDTVACNTQACPIDGSWADWATWGACQVQCTSPTSGEAIQTRTRTCTNPAPQFGGQPCPGQSSEDRECDTFPCRTCKDVLLADPNASSGEYIIVNPLGQTIQVYCAFLNDRMGYTFLWPGNGADLDISTLYTTASEVGIAHLDNDGTQRITVVSQLDSYSSLPMSIQYNSNDLYKKPRNVPAMGPYVYLGLLPIAGITHNGNTEGYSTFGNEHTFTNCDGNPNSYFAFLFNQENDSLDNYSVDRPLVHQWIENAWDMGLSIPNEYFTDFEVHMGGCGGYIDPTDTTLQGASLGLRFDIDPVDVAAVPSLCSCASI